MDINRFERFDAASAVLHPGINLIEASAGTGKTFAIAMLALRFIVERGLSIEQLLIVTFTKAATEELKERIRARLADAKRALDGQTGNGDNALAAWMQTLPVDKALARQRLQLALLDIDRAGIFTIHGFCQRVLNEHALESGQVFGAELSGDLHAIRRQIAADFWRLRVVSVAPHIAAVYTAQCATPDALLHAAGNIADDVPLFPADGDSDAALAALRDAAQRVLERLPDAAAAIGGALPDNYFKSAYGETFASRAQALQDWLAAFLRSDGGNVPELPALDVLARQTLLDALNGNKFRSSKAQSGEQRKQQYLAELGIDSAPFDALQDAFRRFNAAFRCEFVRYLRREREKILRQRNEMSFDDLIGRLAQALSGERSQWLQNVLRQRFKAALIDEFQDTDQQQWLIFATLFGAGGAYLYLIGDPKQAIYKFRGADIFSYFDAQRQAQRHYTLEYNWRSQPPLVEAVNALFNRHARPFWFEQLHFITVQAALAEEHPQFLPPLQLWQLAESGSKDGYWTAGKARQAIQAAVVQEILQLCGGEPPFPPTPAQDIAVLVRTNRSAREYQQALQAAGVPAVLNSVESVFAAPEARDLYALLQALAAPGDGALLRQALTLPWFGLDGRALYRLGNDEAALDEWTLRFQNYHRQWQEKGFMAMMLAVLQRENVRAQLARYGNAERQIANIQHLLELVQQACIEEHLGIRKTLEWLRAAVAEAEYNNADDRQLRLESDAQAVQIVTLHRSKGLEYPLVFCPDLWQRGDRLTKETYLVECHEQGRRIADLGSERFEARREQALQEELAEDLRIVYVALTRAKYRCYLVWADVRTKERANASALAYLLFSEGGAAWREALKDFGFAAQRQALQSFCAQSRGFRYRLLDAEPLPAFETPCSAFVEKETADFLAERNEFAPPSSLEKKAAGGDSSLTALTRTRNLHTDWQMSSYTALSALSLHDAPELPEDKAQEAGIQEHGRQQASSYPCSLDSGNPCRNDEVILKSTTLPPDDGLPKGAHTGNVVHELLETLDFRLLAEGGDIAAARRQACRRYGLAPEQPQQIDALLQSVVQTPLSADDAEFYLANIPARQCVKEMPFYLAMPRLGTEAINRILDACPAFQPLQPKQLQGFLTGFIDLVCRYRGRYYVLDYKTNALADYRTPHITAAMREHNYGLQYWLYALVLHRYLQNRLPGYDYAKHFGGIRYLFVRGMAPEQPMRGVYEDLPDYARLQLLADLFD
jgi:exodeoxyribonuclease V beta subunit